MRARIDVSEIEAKTKIRAKYLRRWRTKSGPAARPDVREELPAHLRAALGLDGKALVEEYRLSHERPSEPLEPIVGTRGARAAARAGGSDGPSRGYLALVGIVARLIVLLVVGLLTGGGGGSPNTLQHAAGAAARARHTPRRTARGSRAPRGSDGP